MQKREIKKNIFWLGAIDWDRRLFDALVPLPDGTSYNAYLVKGESKTALLDTVDSGKVEVIINQLRDIDVLDYIVVHHAEQDHSGSLPAVLAKYPNAKIVTTSKCQSMLQDFYPIESEKFVIVKDGDHLDLGGRTLEFFYTPWVHWPETMISYLREEKILFTCDLFGSHLAASDLFATDKMRVYDAAKRYYAEIMMPFQNKIAKYLEKFSSLEISMIAPSHGPIYDDPAFIMDAYREWVLGSPKNLVVLPFVSMHGSTRQMVDMLIDELVKRDVSVQPFDLTSVDLGKLAESLVDAATIVIATPTVLNGAHPNAVYAAYLANVLKPKAKYVSVIGSMGWGGKVAEQLAGMLSNLKVELIEPVICKGVPGPEDKQAIANLAETIAAKHKAL
jgi:flavorubredoxin